MDSSKKDNFVAHVAEIPAGVTETQIKAYFKDHAGVDVRIGTLRQVRNATIPLQWARVDFKTPEAYTKAIEEHRFPIFLAGHSSRLLPNNRDIVAKDISEKNIFVKGLDKAKYDNKELYDIFKQFGDIDSSKVSKTVKKEDDRIVSTSNGYGFVKFSDKEKAKEVIENAKLADPDIVVQPFTRSKPQISGNNLYVKNFSNDVDEEKLKSAFEKFGEITSVKIMDDTANERKFGYVCFKEIDSATQALDLDGSEVADISDSLYVKKHVKKSERQKVLNDAYRKQNLFVRNFGDNVSEQNLNDLFSQFGKIVNTKILTKKTNINGQDIEVSQCKGFVCFNDPLDAKKAIDEARERGIWFDSKRLNVNIYEPKSERVNHNNKNIAGMNPEISDFIMNILQTMNQGGMMGGMNFMGGPQMPPPMGGNRGGYQNKPPGQNRGPPRHDMYRGGPPPQQNMQSYAPNFNQNMMGHNMPQPMMGGQQIGGYDPKMAPPPNNMGAPGMMPPQNRGMPMNVPPMNQVSEDQIYATHYNEVVNDEDYINTDENGKRNKFGDLIFPYVEKMAGPDNAPKITGMIIDLAIEDLLSYTNTLASLKEKISEGIELLHEEEANQEGEDQDGN